MFHRAQRTALNMQKNTLFIYLLLRHMAEQHIATCALYQNQLAELRHLLSQTHFVNCPALTSKIHGQLNHA